MARILLAPGRGECRAGVFRVGSAPWDLLVRTQQGPKLAMKVATRSLQPHHVVALGLTWRDHVRETGERVSADGPARFERDPASLATTDRVRVPTQTQLIEALEQLEAGLGAEVVNRHRIVPALFDYEIELGVQILEGGQLGWMLANDLTARTIQIMGEGSANRMRFWSASKSFPATLLLGSKMLVSDQVPDVELVLRVRGEVRQRARTSLLMYSAADLVRFASRGRPLATGDVVLTGTPAGVAFSVSRWQRATIGRMLGRVGRLSAAMRAARRTRRYLEPGDAIEMQGGPLGPLRAIVERADESTPGSYP
jgi:2-keto-4-pentenoate hydratase/2-oxohepta-3-ene-1,7-dioic acid hydratase in catechol pathway